jgi:DNA-binding transcriptional LysR family regulator
MDWDKLRLFYEVAKYPNITAAAEALHITQSALSRSIILLEHQAKKILFNRSKSGITLTKDGKILLSCVKNMVLDLEVANKVINNDNDTEPSGILKILTNEAIASTWLIHYVDEFLEKYPKVILQINCDNKRVCDSETDVYVGTYLENRKDIIQTFIKTFYLKLFAGKKYINKFGLPQSPEDLDNHKLITLKSFSYTTGDMSTHWLLKLGVREGHVRDSYLQINSAHGLLNAARNNIGIVAIGSEHPILEKAMDELIPILPDYKSEGVDIYYSYPTQMKSVRSVTEFCNFLQNKFSKDAAFDSKLHLVSKSKIVL